MSATALQVTSLEYLLPLITYPVNGPADLAAATAHLGGDQALSSHLAAFGQAMAGRQSHEWEEEYTRAFDLSPIAVPYVSIHLYGEESYKRGLLMAWLNDLYAAHGFTPEAEELPDHFRSILRFLLTVPEADARELAAFCLCGPVQWMKEKLEAANSPYQHLLSALQQVIGEAPRAVDGSPLPPAWDVYKSAMADALPGWDTRTQWEQEFGKG
ncbi:MAG: hypothetical protein GEEBNDBF_00621 [bacterium]|nr:hypothetical protein [bacterium]